MSRRSKERVRPRLHYPGDDGRNVTIAISARVVKVSYHAHPKRTPATGRGFVFGLSRASRLRLLTLLARILWDTCKPISLLTLTYADALSPRSAIGLQLDRQRMWRRMEKTWGEMAGIWRVEYMQRKTGANVGVWYPHLHVVIVRAPFMPQAEIERYWTNIVGIKSRVDIRIVPGGAAEYIAKYAAKVECENSSSLVNGAYPNKADFRGRKWGVFRRRMIPIDGWRSIRIPAGQLTDRLHMLAKTAGLVCPAYDSERGYRLLGKLADAARFHIRDMGYCFPVDLPVKSQ